MLAASKTVFVLLFKFLRCHGQTGSEQVNGCPPAPGIHHPPHQPLRSAHWRESPAAQRYSVPGPSCSPLLGRPPDVAFFANVSANGRVGTSAGSESAGNSGRGAETSGSWPWLWGSTLISLPPGNRTHEIQKHLLASPSCVL